MVVDFLVVIMTKHLQEQLKFYQDALKLEQIFNRQETVGLGKAKRLFLVLREDKNKNSHHLTEQKGPQLLTFKCRGKVDDYIARIRNLGYKIRDTLQLPEHNTHYLFIEDYDGNEICLDFPCSEEKR